MVFSRPTQAPIMSTLLSNRLFCDFLHCPCKAHLILSASPAPRSDFELMLDRQQTDYRRIADNHLSQSVPKSETCWQPLSLPDAIKHGHALIIDADTAVQNMTCHFDALLRISIDSTPNQYIPILYVPAEKVARQHKLLLAFLALILGDVQGNVVQFGKIVHGSALTTTRLSLRKLLPPTRQAIKSFTDLRCSTTPPPLRLNDHCKVCAFKEQCHSKALEKDDLSLMQGLRGKQIATLNTKGILTVTQFSFTFRRARSPKAWDASFRSTITHFRCVQNVKMPYTSPTGLHFLPGTRKSSSMWRASRIVASTI